MNRKKYDVLTNELKR